MQKSCQNRDARAATLWQGRSGGMSAKTPTDFPAGPMILSETIVSAAHEIVYAKLHDKKASLHTTEANNAIS
jgi:hypothetical protein